MNTKVYEIITEKIIDQLESGSVPWVKPWIGGEPPKNYISKKPYRGINPFLLACQGYASPFWLSFKQAQAAGGTVKKGEKGSMVVFWKMFEGSELDKSGKPKMIPMLRYYTVFNTDQCEGLTVDLPTTGEEFQPIDKAESIVDGMQNKPVIRHAEPRAYYRPSTDLVNMPRKELFESAEGYYSTLFHELGHSTGHKSRLERKDFAEAAFGSETYSKEELIAEFTSAFLCGISGIEKEIKNQAAYIQGWLKVLKSDCKMAVLAAAQAQKAADYITG